VWVKARPKADVPAQLENVYYLLLARLKIKNKEKQKVI
jgi:hypothetical protein